MTMRAASALLAAPLALAALAVSLGPAAAGAAGKVAGAGRIEASVVHLPGRLVAAAVARGTHGRLGFALLVDDEIREHIAGGGGKGSPAHPRGATAAPSPARPRTVFFVEPGKPELELVADDVPAKIDSLAALSLPDGDQAADLLVLGEPGALYLLDPPWGGAHPRCRQVLAAPGLDLRSVHLDKEGSPRPRLPWLPVARAGRLQLLAARQPTAGELTAIATYPLPVTASREAWGLELASRPVHLLPGAPGAPPRFAVGPEAQGAGARLRTLLLSSAPGEPPVEAWSLFPGAEKAGEGVYSSWDGKPALLLRSFAKLGLFTKRDLRLYLLSRDRSRAGAPPVIAVHTDCALWHELGAYLADAGGNGRQDLVLIHREGLRGKKLRFQVYPSLGQGRLAAQPRVSSLDVEADDWFYGADLSGDGIPDLLVRSQGRLLLYPGAGKSYRLAERPSWSFSLSAPPGGSAAARKKTAADKKTAAGKQQDETRTEVQVQAGGERRAARVVTARGRGFGDLVDLRGDGRPILFLATVDDDGGSQITLVGRYR
jgi:hypothetical protein